MAEAFPQIRGYQILAEVGRGGMGVVYQARHLGLNRVVALKVVNDDHVASRTYVLRFKREAAVCARIDHPNVIRVLDYGDDGGLCYYAMELLQAPTLLDLIVERGHLPCAEVLRVGAGLAAGLSCIHELGLVHRDVKPANLMVGPGERVTLMDFGLVKDFEATALTQTGKVIGSPRYMSPELVRGGPVDVRSDVFQAGILLYEALTGRAPFEGSDVPTIARGILKDAPTPPGRLVEGLDPLLEGIVLSCLEKRPEARPASGGELAAELERCRVALGFLPGAPARPGVGARTRTGPDRLERAPEPGTAPPGHEPVTETHRHEHRPRHEPAGRPAPPPRLTRSHLTTITLLLALLVWYSLARSGPPPSWDALDLTGIPDVGGAVLTWSSSAPYPSRANLWDVRDPATVRSVQARTSTRPTTDHRVVVDGLEPGAAYTFAVVYPDGRTSLPRSLEPLPRVDLTVTDHETSWPDPTTLRLKVVSSVPCRASASWRLEGFGNRRPLTTSPSREHVLTVTEVPPEGGLDDVVLTLETELVSARVPLGRLHGAAAAVPQLAAAAAAFDPLPVLAALEPSLRAGGTPDEARIRTYLSHVLAASRPWAVLERFRPLIAPLLPLLPDARALELYRALRRFEAVDQFLDERRLPVTARVRELHDPLLRPTWSDAWPQGSSVELFTLLRTNSDFEPVRSAQGPGTVLPEMAANRRRAFSGSFLLTRIPRRPRLVLRVRNLTPAFHVALRINDGPPLDLRNTASSTPPEILMPIVAPDGSESADYLRSVNYLGIALPSSMLRPGPNRLEFEVGTYPGFVTLSSVQVREGRLYDDAER